MLEYDRTNISQETDINKTNPSKEWNICHFWYYGYHDLMQKTMNFNDVAIVSVKGSDYTIYFWYMSKSDPINILKHSDLNEKIGLL